MLSRIWSRNLWKLFLALMGASFILAACNTELIPELPISDQGGFEFQVDPQSQTVTFVADKPPPSSLQPQYLPSDTRVLVPDVDISLENYHYVFHRGNKLVIQARFKNITEDTEFYQPFFFTLSADTINIKSASAPLVLDKDLGGDGVLSPQEKTAGLTFEVIHKGKPFKFFVDASAIVSAPCVIEGEVTITNQIEANALRGCTVIRGSLTISPGQNVIDLSPLSALEEVGGDLSFADYEVMNHITGLPALTTVDGSLFIRNNNPALLTVGGFTALKTIGGGLHIDNGDPSLTSITGFNTLTSVGGRFEIDYHPSLSAIDGFEALERVEGEFEIGRGNQVLGSIRGFNALAIVNGPQFSISGNASLTSVEGFASLTDAGILNISRLDSNSSFDCSIPPQSTLPFLPVDISFGNLVNCRTKSQIAFTSFHDEANGEIYVMNADGSQPTRLTFSETTDAGPTWSPDGRRLAFTSLRDGNWEIYVMNADGTQQINLTKHQGTDGGITWSPDGSKIAFDSNRDGDFEIYIMNADGSNPVKLTNNSVYDMTPAWSPDGSTIVFHRFDSENGTGGLFAMKPDGADQIQLVNTSASDLEPDWSPDGSKIAFASVRNGDADIYIMNADGTNHTRLTYNVQSDFDPSWSPDSSQLAFWRGTSEGGDIYVMNADGTDQVNLTNTPWDDAFPDWRPKDSTH